MDQHGELLGRPWLTTIVDTYSRCIIGVNLGFDAPSSQVVALAIRNAILPKCYGADYKLHCEWGTYGSPEHFFTDGGKDFRSNHLQLIATDLGFTCHLRRRPSEGGIVERPFGTFNTQLFSTLPGYTGSNVQERPKDAENEASLTLRELEHLVVRFICDRYNQSIDARMGDQTRFQRWEAGLPRVPAIIDERDLDICLMKASRRRIQRGCCIQFENLLYRGEYLAGYAGETVSLRFNPSDITTVLIYRRKDKRETFLARAYAQGLETEQLSYEEAKASSRRIREAGKTLSNASILQESIEREALIKNKSRKKRQKEEQILAKAQPVPTAAEDLSEPDVDTAEPKIDASIDSEAFEPIDFDDMRGAW